jgi:hypothetical protein
MYIGFHIKYLPILKKSRICLQILVKIPDIKFHKNQLVIFTVFHVDSRPTDKQKDTTKLIVDFCKFFADVPEHETFMGSFNTSE